MKPRAWPELAGRATRSHTVAFLLSDWLGPFGVDGFDFGQHRLRVAKVLTSRGARIRAVVDCILIGMGKVPGVDDNSLRCGR